MSTPGILTSFVYFHINQYKSRFVYCRELAPGIVTLTRDRVRGDASKHYAISTHALNLV